MTGVYLFAAAAGLPLIAWFLLAGAEEGGADDGGGLGGVMLRLLPLSTIAIVMATFGVCGLVLGAVDTPTGTTFVASALSGAFAGLLNSTAFAYLRRSESSTAVGDAQLAGSIGRIVLPVGGEHRGRVALSAGGQQLYLSARALPGAASGELEVGASVLVVEVRDGVATVAPLDPELA